MSDRPTRRRRRTLGWCAAALLAVSACGRGDGDGGEPVGQIRPFAEVQADEFTFEADPANPEQAIFRVTTTEPMICAIVSLTVSDPNMKA